MMFVFFVIILEVAAAVAAAAAAAAAAVAAFSADVACVFVRFAAVFVVAALGAPVGFQKCDCCTTTTTAHYRFGWFLIIVYAPVYPPHVAVAGCCASTPGRLRLCVQTRP